MAHAGFDTDIRPPQSVIDALWHGSNFAFIVHYLAPTPSHQDTSWVGAYQRDKAQGWGVGHVYVGRELQGPGDDHATATNGVIDGQDACRLLAAEGVEPGRTVFLDVEGTLYAADYISAWAKAVEAGGYKAGVYCSHLLAHWIAEIVPEARLWVVKVSTTTLHPVNGSGFPDGDPAAISGVPNAWMCQCDEEASLVDYGRLAVDFDTCVQKDPSAP